MYRRLAQLEKLVENDNFSSRRPYYDIFSAWMTGSAVVDLKMHHKGEPSQNAVYKVALGMRLARPVIQAGKYFVTRPPRRKIIILHEFFELSEPTVYFSSPAESYAHISGKKTLPKPWWDSVWWTKKITLPNVCLLP